ncbi:hypothetical protein [Vulcanisaeta distributa]|uniref:hypothetical protein n=1 Tax=Vulcanisaeta distributa TaxID=164451 RepID=UPI001FB3629F|nr:hypothetical protein [Vulcanisaeta distributa]
MITWFTTNQLSPPKGIAEVDLIRRLARELEISHPLLLEDPWEAVDKAIRPTGVTLEELRERKIVKIKPRYLPLTSLTQPHCQTP